MSNTSIWPIDRVLPLWATVKLGTMTNKAFKKLLISWTPCLINSQTLKMTSQVISFLCPDKQGTPNEGWRIQWPKRCVSTNNNKDEDSSLKNRIQNITHQPSFQKFRPIKHTCIDTEILSNLKNMHSSKHTQTHTHIYIYIYIYIYILVRIAWR